MDMGTHCFAPDSCMRSLIWNVTTLVAFGLGGCGLKQSLVNDINRAGSVEVGAGRIAPVTIHRSIALGGHGITACPSLTVAVADPNTVSDPAAVTDLSVSPQGDSCALELRQNEFTLVDQDSLNGQQVQSVTAAHLTIEKFSLTDANGNELPPATTFDALELRLDGELVLTKQDIATNEPVRKTLPPAVLESIKSSVQAHQPATAELTMTLSLSSAELAALPSTVVLDITVQPEVTVQVFSASP